MPSFVSAGKDGTALARKVRRPSRTTRLRSTRSTRRWSTSSIVCSAARERARQAGGDEVVRLDREEDAESLARRLGAARCGARPEIARDVDAAL